MKAEIRAAAFFLLLPNLSCATFSELEINQLEDINRASLDQMSAAHASLKKAISTSIKDNPEKQKLITELDTAWQGMIEKKCKLETYESKGTDAEISQYSTCMSKNYLEAENYFNSIQP
ncbi:hypothetical protein [Metapseudomonas furukawaii]|jgi:hypothetical protein|uniref:hypothetical protein n=1 Tax=Metapseudomonas furukawaii TaxID=1149133 RepID=UPI00103903E9|nr:hypothetical protein [Pseudomonas furukawaii]